MDPFEIHDNIERPSGNPGKKKTLGKCSKNINADEDKIHTLEQKRPEPALSAAVDRTRVILGLLCLLLLTGLITLVVLLIKMTKERDQLQTHYNNLTEERDQLQTSYNNLNEERDQLQTSYNNLTKERDELQTSYNNLTEERDQLQTSYNNLTKERDQLQTSYNNLTEEKDHLQTSYNNLTEERDQLQTSYNNMIEERDQLQTSYNNLNNQINQLQTSYNILNNQRNQLQTSYNILNNQRNQLQTSYNNVNNQRAKLQRQLNFLKYYLQQGWFYFSDSIYYISSTKKTWWDSRNDCLWRAADLAIIGSRQEQDFIRQHQKEMWIGLTDRQWEGMWRWVDGSPLTTSFWDSGEPNSHRGQNEDCVEIHSFHSVYNWNDESCGEKNFWICEKKMIL